VVIINTRPDEIGLAAYSQVDILASQLQIVNCVVQQSLDSPNR
jgi:hypothetical protein